MLSGDTTAQVTLDILLDVTAAQGGSVMQHMSESEAQEAYAKMHPEPLSLWTDALKLPEDYKYPTHIAYHYIRFTDDQVGRCAS